MDHTLTDPDVRPDKQFPGYRYNPFAVTFDESSLQLFRLLGRFGGILDADGYDEIPRWRIRRAAVENSRDGGFTLRN